QSTDLTVSFIGWAKKKQRCVGGLCPCNEVLGKSGATCDSEVSGSKSAPPQHVATLVCRRMPSASARVWCSLDQAGNERSTSARSALRRAAARRVRDCVQQVHADSGKTTLVRERTRRS